MSITYITQTLHEPKIKSHTSLNLKTERGESSQRGATSHKIGKCDAQRKHINTRLIVTV